MAAGSESTRGFLPIFLAILSCLPAVYARTGGTLPEARSDAGFGASLDGLLYLIGGSVGSSAENSRECNARVMLWRR